MIGQSVSQLIGRLVGSMGLTRRRSLAWLRPIRPDPAAYLALANLGSSKSRSPSPIRFNPNTLSAIATPG